VDEDYKPENKLPRVHLARRSNEFKHTLKEQPDLKPFFDLPGGQVTVVWQGKVYEVRERDQGRER
jgi:hypothetical protein